MIAALDATYVKTIDCIEEMDVTSVTSTIGLWTAARKPIVSDLGSENFRCMPGKKWLRGLDLEDNQPVNHDVATPYNAYPALSSNIKSGRAKFHK